MFANKKAYIVISSNTCIHNHQWGRGGGGALLFMRFVCVGGGGGSWCAPHSGGMIAILDPFYPCNITNRIIISKFSEMVTTKSLSQMYTHRKPNFSLTFCCQDIVCGTILDPLHPFTPAASQRG